MLTPCRLRGLVHPIRVRPLHLLETDGPATASHLGRRIGESSGTDDPGELTHEQARALSAEVTAVVKRYERERGAPPKGDGAQRAVFQFQMLPDGDSS